MEKPDEYPENLFEPADYLTLGKRINDVGLELPSIDHLVARAIDVFLSPSREVLLSDWKSWFIEAVRSKGLWGFSKSYWTREALFLKRDPRGAGHIFPTRRP